VTAAIGGRKFAISVLGIVCVTGMAMVGATTSEAFIAIGTIVLSYCGGNAVVEWRHAGSSHTERSDSTTTTRNIADGMEPTP